MKGPGTSRRSLQHSLETNFNKVAYLDPIWGLHFQSHRGSVLCRLPDGWGKRDLIGEQ